MHANFYEITESNKPEYPILKPIFSDIEKGLVLSHYELCDQLYGSVDEPDVNEVWVNGEFVGTAEMIYYLGSFREIDVFMLNGEEYHIKLRPIE